MRTKETAVAIIAFEFAIAWAASTVGGDWKNVPSVTLNPVALAYAKQLINTGRVVSDRKGSWAKDRPSALLENEFIQRRGLGEYAKWHLGIDRRYAETNKRRYKFPYGDFKNVHRCGVLAVQHRAGEYNYSEIESAAAQLREMIEATENTRR